MAIASLITGIIVLPSFIVDLFFNPFLEEMSGKMSGEVGWIVGLLRISLIIVGLIIGIIAYRRKAKRRIALTGIVFNSLAILAFIVRLEIGFYTVTHA